MIRTKNRVRLGAVVAVLAMSVAACGSTTANDSAADSSSTPESQTSAPAQEPATNSSDAGTPDAATNQSSAGSVALGKDTVIAIIAKGFQNQYWVAVKNGAQAEADAKGVSITFEGPQTENDVEQQAQLFTTAVARHPSAIAIAALDSKGFGPLLEKAKDAQIPVIAFNNSIESDIPVTTASTDNFAAAQAAAQHLADLLKHTGVVGVMAYSQTSESGIARRDGFVDWMTKNEPNIKLLPVVYDDSDLQKAADLTKAMIAANSDLTGIFAANEVSALGVLTGVKESKNTGLTIVGFDSGKAQKDAIRSGVISGSITQNPVGMGAQIVDSAIAALTGQKQDKVIDTGFEWYDASNVDDPKIAPLLYD
ncbi:MAG: ABC transporter substrate-binding protein [Herbaspirillum sp.]